MIVYRAKQGDTLDLICWQHYGRRGLVPQVLDANPQLDGAPPELPAGTPVTLPDLPAPPAPGRVRLWS